MVDRVYIPRVMQQKTAATPATPRKPSVGTILSSAVPALRPLLNDENEASEESQPLTTTAAAMTDTVAAWKKWGALVVFAVQNAGAVLLMRYSKLLHGPAYSNLAAVMMQELIKLGMSTVRPPPPLPHRPACCLLCPLGPPSHLCNVSHALAAPCLRPLNRLCPLAAALRERVPRRGGDGVGPACRPARQRRGVGAAGRALAALHCTERHALRGSRAPRGVHRAGPQAAGPGRKSARSHPRSLRFLCTQTPTPRSDAAPTVAPTPSPSPTLKPNLRRGSWSCR